MKLGQNTCDTITVSDEETSSDSVDETDSDPVDETDSDPVEIPDPDSSAFFTSATHMLAISFLAVAGNLLA